MRHLLFLPLALAAVAAAAAAQCPTCPRASGSAGAAPTPPARSKLTAENTPAFRLFWRDVARVSPAAETGTAAAAAPRTRPLLVYVYDAKRPDARYAVESSQAFADERTLVGARFFDCVRLDAAAARRDPALRAHVKKTPCLVVLRPSLAAARTLPGKLTAARVYRAQRKALRCDFTNSLVATLQEQRALVKERAALDPTDTAARAALEARERALYALRPR